MTAECQAILEACKLNIKLETNEEAGLEALRPAAASTQWEFAASGIWYEDIYHTGHIAYYIANPAPRCWCMEACER